MIIRTKIVNNLIEGTVMGFKISLTTKEYTLTMTRMKNTQIQRTVLILSFTTCAKG